MATQLTEQQNLKLFGKETKNKIIRISKGPQFRTKGGTILFMLFLMFFLASVAILFQGEFFLALISFVLSIIFFSLVVDVHGIEVNTGTREIRDYKVFLWLKIGKWSDIKDFKSIYVTQKNIVVGNSEYSMHSSDTYHYYHIKLVDELNSKEIILAEYKNYYKARDIAKGVASATGLEFKDFLKGQGKRN